MSEEYKYQRSGKKCREKFENLYKYYKKTREGKAGRQDGKNYRFFRQLEGIYGEPSDRSGGGNRSDDYPRCDRPSPIDLVNVYRVPSTFDNVGRENRAGGAENMMCSPSLTNSMSAECSRLYASSEEGEEEEDGGGGEGELSAIAYMMAENKKMRRSAGSDGQASKMSTSSGSGGRRKGWKEEVRRFVDEQVTRLVERQEEWMDKMLRTIESSERQRARRENEWRERESARLERERELWAKERAWMEARDAAFVDTMRKFSGDGAATNDRPIARDGAGDGERDEEAAGENHDEGASSERWQEHEMLSFIQVVTSMEQRRQQPGSGEETTCHGGGFWETVEARMASLGYDRSATECRSKWRNIGDAFRKITGRDRD